MAETPSPNTNSLLLFARPKQVKGIKPNILFLAFILWNFYFPAFAAVTPTPTPDEEEYVDPRSVSYSGDYVNEGCGFKFTIPKELEGFGNAPFGNHGIYLPFCKDQDCGGIEIFKSFNATFDLSPGDDAGSMTRIQKNDPNKKEWKLLSEKPDQINGCPAWRVESSYTSLSNNARMKVINIFFLDSLDKQGNHMAPPQTNSQMEVDFEAAFGEKTPKVDDRKPPNYAWILSLVAKESEFAQKKKIFDSVLSGLKFIKPDPDEF